MTRQIVDLFIRKVSGQVRCLAVSARDFVHNLDGLFVLAAAHVEFGRLVDGEAGEADEELEQTDAAHDDDKVPKF